MNKPDFHKHPRRFKAWKIATNKTFDYFIMLVIVLNIVQMGIIFENAPIMYTYLLNLTNYFFTAVFFIEMVIKM